MCPKSPDVSAGFRRRALASRISVPSTSQCPATRLGAVTPDAGVRRRRSGRGGIAPGSNLGIEELFADALTVDLRAPTEPVPSSAAWRRGTPLRALGSGISLPRPAAGEGVLDAPTGLREEPSPPTPLKQQQHFRWRCFLNPLSATTMPSERSAPTVIKLRLHSPDSARPTTERTHPVGATSLAGVHLTIVR